MRPALGSALNQDRQNFANVGNFLPDILLPLTNDYAARRLASNIAKLSLIPRECIKTENLIKEECIN